MPLEFVKIYSDISCEPINIIMNCWISLLIQDKEQWVKNPDDNIDISVGSYDSVEYSDFFGLFISYNLITYEVLTLDSKVLYRDDALMILQVINCINLGNKFIQDLRR